ncbi:MAG: 2,5-diketo-D-gluconic acid reductase A [Chlamydiales bacterium]|nr:2,5-diketo-D-gluconic acid reductase A [Chlamydiales bacterium]
MPIEVRDGACQIEGRGYPPIGMGTWPLKGETCAEAVTHAVESGYRIFDTATFYENFVPIGYALRPFERESFYLTSKVWPDSHTPKALTEDLMATLETMQTSYLDAYLLHWPNSKISIEETLHTMQELKEKGYIRHIGLSNVTVQHLKRALEVDVPISWVQNEMHPLYYDPDLLAFCQKHGIGVQAWAPLARGRVREDALLLKVAEKYGKTPSQIALKWIVQHGCLPLPGSKNVAHIKENMNCLDIVLSEGEMDQIDMRAAKGKRFRLTSDYGFGFTDEFDFTDEMCWPLNK